MCRDKPYDQKEKHYSRSEAHHPAISVKKHEWRIRLIVY